MTTANDDLNDADKAAASSRLRLRYERGPDEKYVDLIIESDASDELSWQQYETYIFNVLRSKFPGADIQKNIRLPGKRSDTGRQIDILVRGHVAGFGITMAFDCKHFNRKIDVRHVETFLSTLDDVGVSKGVIITNRGYSRAALNRAEQGGRDVELRLIEFRYLSDYHGLGGAIAWSGSFAMRVTPPSDWVLDNEPVEAPNYTLFAMYPLGYTRELAIRHGAFIYGNVVHKNDALPTLDSIVEFHNANIGVNAAAHGATPKIELLPMRHRNEGRTVLRRAEIHAGYNGPEYSLYVDTPEAVLVLVLLTRGEEEVEYRRKLEWVAEGCEFFRTEDMPSLAKLPDAHPPGRVALRLTLERIDDPSEDPSGA